jgi:hypothetical protein
VRNATDLQSYTMPIVDVVRRYVEGLKDASQLADLLSLQQDGSIETPAASGRPQLYSDYLPTATVLAGVKAGHLHQGHFNASEFNYLEVKSQRSILIARLEVD